MDVVLPRAASGSAAGFCAAQSTAKRPTDGAVTIELPFGEQFMTLK